MKRKENWFAASIEAASPALQPLPKMDKRPTFPSWNEFLHRFFPSANRQTELSCRSLAISLAAHHSPFPVASSVI